MAQPITRLVPGTSSSPPGMTAAASPTVSCPAIVPTPSAPSLDAAASPTSVVELPSLPETGPPHHYMITRLRDNIVKLAVRTDGTIKYDPSCCAFFAAPTSHRAALADPQWLATMTSKFQALQQNSTWSLVPRPPD